MLAPAFRLRTLVLLLVLGLITSWVDALFEFNVMGFCMVFALK